MQVANLRELLLIYLLINSRQDLKEFNLYKILLSRRYILILLSVVSLLFSCNPTKYVPQGETLLNGNHILIDKEGIQKTDLLPYIKQKPNKRIFGARFHLGIYNLSNLQKEKWPHTWLRNIGEEPVIFDSYAMDKSRDQIKSYIGLKGYFNSTVTDTAITVKGKTDVYYNIRLLPPYTVRRISYEIADTNIEKLFYFDSSNCVILKGKPYDTDVLQAERTRFERFVKDQGFYEFSGADHISFRVDSTIGNKKVDIKYIIKNRTFVDSTNRTRVVPHSIYKVRNIYIYPDFIPRKALEGGEAYYKSLDTINYKGYYFVTSKDRPEVKFDLIIQSLYLKPGATFNQTNTEQSQSHLLTLKVYRLVNIYYNESKKQELQPAPSLMVDCNIQLTLLSQQSFKVELEGTNSAGNLGGGVNLIYQDKNLFHGAELFSMKLKGSYEATPQWKIKNTQEYGFETSLKLPRFLLPFLEKESFIKKYNPSTTILAAYNYQAMPLFMRTMASATFGYNWKAGLYKEHFINPLQLNVVKLPPNSIDSAFAARIATSSYLAYSYRDVMILGGNYSYIFNNQKINKSRDFWFLRINAESSGNMLSLVEKLTGAKKTDNTYQILGQPFAQYIRTDIDVRYNYIFSNISSIVYRGFIGVGVPYGNSKAIPFEKQYFGGGANGIRAWQVRTLGPGSYNPGTSSFINQTADIKLEANAEYRYKLFWILEGALFVDAGNIYSYNYDSSRPGAQFTFNNFYKDIAVGTGMGFRFDFKYVIGRLDIGMKLRDPVLTNGSRWIFARRPYDKDDFAWVVAIGYPF